MALRFAVLIRVSTERQEKKGESLLTQRADAEAAVAQLGGTVVEVYGGQEHGTPGWERKELDRLLADAPRGLFDALVVPHADRWSRDNRRSKEGLGVLREAKIKFYVLTQEYDLYCPTARLFLGMSAEIGEFQAGLQSSKALRNRIARAKRGWPAAGNLPWGRTFDKESGRWGVDQAKQAVIADVARRYLGGESLEDLAAVFGIPPTTLRDTLMKRCGPVWQQEFRSASLNVHETVPTPVPELLPPEVIAAVRARAVANTNVTHRGSKNDYLLSRVTFCAGCGYALFGATVTKGGKALRYYRHQAPQRKRLRPCPHHGAGGGWVHADDLEEAVLRQLFELFGNPVAMQAAVVRATPDAAKLEEARGRLAAVAGELEKVREGRGRLVRMVAKGTFKEEDVEAEMARLAERECRLQDESARLLGVLKTVPEPEAVKARTAKIADYGLRLAMSYHVMTWEEKRALVQLVFGGRTPDGRRMGVYLTPVTKGNRAGRGRWDFRLEGHLVDAVGTVPDVDGDDSPFSGTDAVGRGRTLVGETNNGWSRPAATTASATPGGS